MDYNEVISLINKIENSKFNNFKIKFENLELELGKDTVHYEKAKRVVENSMPVETVNETVPVEDVKVSNETESFGEDLSKYKAVKSPIVGVFYSKPAPDKEPFVKVGDKVKKGDVLCIVEAMKVLNEIKSEFDGEIVKIDVSDEDVVEFGKPLIYIK